MTAVSTCSPASSDVREGLLHDEVTVCPALLVGFQFRWLTDDLSERLTVMQRANHPEFRSRAVPWSVRDDRRNRPRSTSSTRSRCRSGCVRTTSTTDAAWGHRHRRRPSCVRPRGGSMNSRPSWPSSATPRSPSRRTPRADRRPAAVRGRKRRRRGRVRNSRSRCRTGISSSTPPASPPMARRWPPSWRAGAAIGESRHR